MTAKQLHALETELQRRGYCKWTRCLSSHESWGWFKTFGRRGRDYEVEFRVWDHTQCIFPVPDWDAYGIDIWTTPRNHLNNSLEVDWDSIADIDAIERLAADFNTLIRKYIKE